MELGPIHMLPVRDDGTEHRDHAGDDRGHPTESDSLLSSLSSSPPDIRRVPSLTSLSITMETADSTLNDNNGDDDDAFTENPKSTTGLSAMTLLRGRLTLLCVAFLFGSFNVILRLLYALPGPPAASVLSATRGWLAVACFSHALWSGVTDSNNNGVSSAKVERGIGSINMTAIRRSSSMWVSAGELALWNFGALALLNVGLLFVESARASFLTQTSVVITPLVSSVSGQRVGRKVWAGCAAALVGLVLLSDKGRPASGSAGGLDDDVNVGDTSDDGLSDVASTIESVLSSLSFSAGDLLVLGGAASWSLYIFRLSTLGNQHPEIPLQAIKTLLIAFLYTIWVVASATRCYFIGGWDAVADLWLSWRSWHAWALLTFSAVGTGALADVLQQFGQKMVSASEANVLLCIEPVFTMMLGRVLLGETTSTTEKAGGVLIVFAALLASR